MLYFAPLYLCYRLTCFYAPHPVLPIHWLLGQGTFLDLGLIFRRDNLKRHVVYFRCLSFHHVKIDQCIQVIDDRCRGALLY